MRDRMCEPLCDAILRDSSVSGQTTLEYLERSNLSTVASNYQSVGVEEKLQATETTLASKVPSNAEMDEWTRNLVGKIAVARALLTQTLYQASQRANEYQQYRVRGSKRPISNTK